MSVIDDLLAKKPEQRTVEFCMDRSLIERLEYLRGERDRLVEASWDDATVPDAVTEAKAAYDEAVEQVRAQLIRFTFAAVEPTVWDQLKAEHRPTEAQKADAKRKGTVVPEWNADTFMPALIAAACVEVSGPSGTETGLSIEEARAIWSSSNWNEAERADLGNAAALAYLTRTKLDLPPKAG